MSLSLELAVRGFFLFWAESCQIQAVRFSAFEGDPLDRVPRNFLPVLLEQHVDVCQAKKAVHDRLRDPEALQPASFLAVYPEKIDEERHQEALEINVIPCCVVLQPQAAEGALDRATGAVGNDVEEEEAVEAADAVVYALLLREEADDFLLVADEYEELEEDECDQEGDGGLEVFEGLNDVASADLVPDECAARRLHAAGDHV